MTGRGTTSPTPKILLGSALSLLAFLALAEPNGNTSGTDACVEKSGLASYRQRVAICIGINRYPTHPQLRYAVSDALEMANAFEGMGFDRVVLLSDEEATRDRIMMEIESFRNDAAEDDLLVFYFAGHGWTARNEQGEPSGYLVPFDCERGRETEQGLSMIELSSTINAMPTRHVLLLVDACYSGYGIHPAEPARGKGRREATASSSSKNVDGRSIQILTAGGAMDQAFESDGHGLFTRNILECLRGLVPEAADGVLSGTELAIRVKHNVETETGGWQKPRFGCSGDGEITLVLTPATPPGSRLAMAQRSEARFQ